MRFLFSLLFMVLTAGVFISGVVFVISKTFVQMLSNPESKAWKKTIERLRERLTRRYPNLIPWDKEMLSLLSLNRELKKPGWFDNVYEGVYLSIFQEPILAFVQMKSGGNGVMVARTSDREFIFRQKSNETEIWVNGQPFAVLVNGNLMAAGKGSRLIAQVDTGTGEAQFPVTFGNQTAASINNPEHAAERSPNPRVLTLLRDVNPEEDNALMALAILQMAK
ncbi:MAG: hypothetical protein IT270_12525 [Saprospiraceae bacterium]|nr:hypothetical protein [Saprospiraceae bacterium]